MIAIVYPRSVNWFYSAQAMSIAGDLSAAGVPARAVASDEPWHLADCDPDLVLIVSFAESRHAAGKRGMDVQLLRALRRFGRRILVNFDSLQSRWFDSHLTEGRGYFAEIFDVGLFRQTDQPQAAGIPYRFVPEAFAAADLDRIEPWREGRPIPWAMLGHETVERAALVEAALRCLPRNGFVFMPPLRPFTETSGLNRAGLARVLARTDLYIWGSHHHFPYHETQRALHAVASGAIPVKIDPRHSDRLQIPWVYPSVRALVDRRDRVGLQRLYAEARHYLGQQGTIGQNMRAALGLGEPARPLLAETAVAP